MVPFGFKKHLFKNIPYIVSTRISEELATNLLKDNYPDAKKHLTDVIRLATMLDGEESIVLTDNPKKDYLEFRI